MPVHERLQMARALAAQTWPYLSHALFRLRPVERTQAQVPTLAVDRNWKLYYCKEWLEANKLGRIALALAGHELGHLLGSHHRRGMTRGPEANNYAGDLAINSGIHAFGAAGVKFRNDCLGIKMPEVDKAMTPDPKWLYPEKCPASVGGPFPIGLLLEDYLEKLIVIDIRVSGCGAGQCGSAADGEPKDYEEASGPGDVTEQDAQVIARITAENIKEHAGKYPGTLPGNMEDWADFILEPAKVPWQQNLRTKVRNAVKVVAGQQDYTYTKLSRRRLPAFNGGRRPVLPGLIAYEPKIGVVLDTSGSMQESDYIDVLSELAQIIKLQGGKGVPVVCTDTKAHEVRVVKNPAHIWMAGGGGTDMSAGIKAMVELGMQLGIVLTDGLTGWGSEPPRTLKVVACLTRRPESGFPVPAWAKSVYCGDD